MGSGGNTGSGTLDASGQVAAAGLGAPHLEQVPHDDWVRDDDEGFWPERQLVDAAAVQKPAGTANPCPSADS